MKGRDKLIESSEKGHQKESTNPGKDTDQTKSNYMLFKSRQQMRLDKVNWTKEQGYYLYQKALE